MSSEQEEVQRFYVIIVWAHSVLQFLQDKLLHAALTIRGEFVHDGNEAGLLLCGPLGLSVLL